MEKDDYSDEILWGANATKARSAVGAAESLCSMLFV